MVDDDPLNMATSCRSRSVLKQRMIYLATEAINCVIYTICWDRKRERYFRATRLLLQPSSSHICSSTQRASLGHYLFSCRNNHYNSLFAFFTLDWSRVLKSTERGTGILLRDIFTISAWG